MRFAWSVVSLAFALLVWPAPAAETVFYVSPRGNDAWSGRRAEPAGDDGPLATLPAAVRQSRARAAEGPRRIVLAAGRYLLDEPVVLGPEDADLTIEGAAAGTAILCGGRPVTGWQPDGDRFWSAAVPEVARGEWDFRLLVVDGQIAPRARLPQEGHLTHLSEFPIRWMSTTGGGWERKPTTEELTTLRYRPADLGPWLDVKNAELTVYHMWDESVVGLAEHDATNHVLRFSTPAGHPPGAFGVQRYVVWNVRQGMTSPGQWYLDRTAGKVVYWPLPGQVMASLEVFAPQVESIVRIAGREGQPVRNVTLHNLSLTVTNTPLVAGGFGASRFAGAIELVHAEGCVLAGLEVANVAGQGIKGWRLDDGTIEECHVHDTGAGGIKCGGQCTVRNNRIHHVGRLYPSAIGLWGGDDRGICRIEHNTVHDTPYTAIACGGNDHVIAHNRIFRAMQTLHDGAGIYITFCKRITLRGNYIHDIVDTGGYGASAYYLDEQAEDCLVEGNLSVRVARPSHNHMARKNTLRGNVFVCAGDATITFPRSAEFTLEQNVIVADGTIRVTNPAAVTAAHGNVVFSRAGKVEGVALDDYREAGAAALPMGAAWLPADPQLRLDERGRATFAPDGPAARLGIAPLDVSAAGARTDSAAAH